MAGPMKLSVRLAWLCGTGVSALLTCTQVFRQVNLVNVLQGNQIAMEPVSALLLSLGGGAVGAALGYMMGDILAMPKGCSNGSKKGKKQQGRHLQKAVTGQETFLDDLQPADKTSGSAAPAAPHLEAYDSSDAGKTPEEQATP